MQMYLKSQVSVYRHPLNPKSPVEKTLRKYIYEKLIKATESHSKPDETWATSLSYHILVCNIQRVKMPIELMCHQSIHVWPGTVGDLISLRQLIQQITAGNYHHTQRIYHRKNTLSFTVINLYGFFFLTSPNTSPA